MPSGVQIKGLTKRYGEAVAVEEIDIDVNPGDLVALLGPSGCGKTTTLRSVCGLEHIDAGEIQIGDRVVSSARDDIHIPPYHRNLGMVFQSHANWPHMSVRENVTYPLKKRDMSVEDWESRLDELLTLVELSGFEDRPVTQLSGGQQQRVSLARAMIHEPDVLLMDEPLSSLDARLRRSMLPDIRAIQQKQEITTIYVTHDQLEAMYVADQIYLMRDGEIVESGTPEKIYNDPVNPFSMRFFDPNEPLSGRATSINNSRMIVEVDGLNSSLEVERSTPRERQIEVGDVCDIYIRPDHINPIQSEGETSENTVEGIIQVCAFQAQTYQITINAGPYELICNTQSRYDTGELLRFELPAEKIKVFKQ